MRCTISRDNQINREGQPNSIPTDKYDSNWRLMLTYMSIIEAIWPKIS